MRQKGLKNFFKLHIFPPGFQITLRPPQQQTYMYLLDYTSFHRCHHHKRWEMRIAWCPVYILLFFFPNIKKTLSPLGNSTPKITNLRAEKRQPILQIRLTLSLCSIRLYIALLCCTILWYIYVIRFQQKSRYYKLSSSPFFRRPLKTTYSGT